MSEYTIIDNITGERHDLDHENMADIQCAVEMYLTHLHKSAGMPSVNCMPETWDTIKPIRVSATDY